MKTYKSPDGVEWKVETALPGSSNIMVMFRHPDGRTVIVTHPRKDIPAGTMLSIYRQAGWSKD